jgi:hypothetical protein
LPQRKKTSSTPILSPTLLVPSAASPPQSDLGAARWMGATAASSLLCALAGPWCTSASGPHRRPPLWMPRRRRLIPAVRSLVWYPSPYLSPYLCLLDLPLPALADARSDRALGPRGHKPLLRVLSQWQPQHGHAPPRWPRDGPRRWLPPCRTCVSSSASIQQPQNSSNQRQTTQANNEKRRKAETRARWMRPQLYKPKSPPPPSLDVMLKERGCHRGWGSERVRA